MNKRITKPFLWGASTSAFQVEGGYNEDGKGLSTTDMRKVPEGIADSKVASDHYHHYKEDIELMNKLGIQVYRFSFSWARIMGDGFQVNEQGLEFYEEIIDLCLKNNILPFPTLYHFEMPKGLVDTFGGWKSRQCIDAFEKYAITCFERFKTKVKLWGTINEQLIVTAASDLNGNHEKNATLKIKQMYQMSYHMSLAEKKVIKAFRAIIPDGKIGPVCSMQVIYAQTSKPEDILASVNAKDMLLHMFLDMSVYGRYPLSVTNYLNEKGFYPNMFKEDLIILKKSTPDFIGINYYASTCVKAKDSTINDNKLPPFFRNDLFAIADNPFLTKTKWMEFGIDPEGLYIGIREIYERYHLPIMITENGMAYSETLGNDGKIHDDYRIDYLEKHITQCIRLVDEGYPLMGYCPWSLLDLVSSHQGFSKRYGLIFVDRTDTEVKSCERIPKDSYYWYQRVIKNNGLEK